MNYNILRYCSAMIFGLLAASTCLHAQTATQEKPAADAPPIPAKRPIKISDAPKWERISQFAISKDANWQAHMLRPGEGDAKLLIGQINGDKKYNYVVGPSSGQVAFSHNSKWIAFVQAPLDKAAKAARKMKKPLKNKLVILELESGKKREYEGVQSYSFSGELDRYVAMHKSRPAGRPSGDAGWNGTDLVLIELESGNQTNIGNVRSFRFNKSGKLLAMIIDAEGKSGNGVQVFETESARIRTLINDAAEFKSLNWTKEGDALACLKSSKNKKFELPMHQIVAFSDVASDQVKTVVVDPAKDPNIPDDMTITASRAPSWTDDRNALIFGIHSAKPKEEKKADPAKNGSASAGDQVEEADLVVWHWKDKRMQSQQQVQEARDRNQYFLCTYRVGEKKTIRLANDEIPSVSVSKPYRFAIGRDNSKYELQGNLDGQRYSDVFVVDMFTGKRKLALEKARYVYGTSPAGEHLLYYENGHFHIYNMVTGEKRNVTESVPVSFINTESDVNVKNPPQRNYGWTSDSRSVLLSDGFDIWQVPVAGGESKNLTVNGKTEQIRYGRFISFDPDVTGTDLSQTQYLSMYGEWTKKSGFGRIEAGKTGVEVLKFEDAAYSFLQKVKDQDVYYFSRASHNQPSNYFVSGPDLKDEKQLTQSNQQHKNFMWSEGRRLVDYTSDNGDKLQAALFLPANYIEGKKYPTIVYIYEKLSQRLNNYDTPRHGGFSTSIYTSRGYAVLMPDIVYQINDPGLSSKACVLPALQAAVDTGVVDPERVGLHGHSWGGYQTSFLITQTDKFKAAVAGAPLTNLISMYSSVYWNSGSANQPIFESSQGRFTGGYWTNIEAYTRNSPVYFAEKVNTPLLLLHNDKDGAVDWNQGIEYFNTLRRLKKPVVMLQYKGENHGLRKVPNRKDYSYRMMEFFDHYLRDKPAAKWWSDGVKHLDHKKHIKAHRESQK